MTVDDIAPLSQWMVTIPLWQRYNLTIERAALQFRTALDRNDVLLVLDEPERNCGFAWVMPDAAFGRSAYLRLFGVHPNYANRGLGATLLQAVEQRVSGFSKDLFLLAADFNTAAQNFYRKQGYEQIGSISGYVLPEVSEYIFRKRLVVEP